MSINPKRQLYLAIGLTGLITLLLFVVYLPKFISNAMLYYDNQDSIEHNSDKLLLLRNSSEENKVPQTETFSTIDLKELVLKDYKDFHLRSTHLKSVNSSVINEPGIKIEAVYLSFSGSFKDLLRLCLEYESTLNYAQLTSASFHKKDKDSPLLLDLIIEKRNYEA